MQIARGPPLIFIGTRWHITETPHAASLAMIKWRRFDGHEGAQIPTDSVTSPSLISWAATQLPRVLGVTQEMPRLGLTGLCQSGDGLQGDAQDTCIHAGCADRLGGRRGVGGGRRGCFTGLRCDLHFVFFFSFWLMLS